MRDLETLTRGDFEPCLNEVFVLVEGDQRFELRLAEVRPISGGPAGKREPFSLVFHGDPRLRAPQRIHRLENTKIGVLELFLVQIAGDASVSKFEAIFY